MSDPSVAVVVLDTLRHDIFSRYFEWLPGIRFINAYSTANWTVPAHASLLTGRYASELGVHSRSRCFDCPHDSITERLANAGYRTRFWTANIQVHTWDGWNRGFDSVRGPTRLHPRGDRSAKWDGFDGDSYETLPTKAIAAFRWALAGDEPTIPTIRHGSHRFRDPHGDTGARDLLERCRQTDFQDREFLLLNLMEAHTPHHPPEDFRRLNERVNFRIGDAFAGDIERPDRNRIAYDDSAAYLSSIYHELFTTLRETFDYIITLSDHGELLGEHGMWNHGYGLYPQLTHVPLLLSGSDIKDETREDIVSLLDIPATLANLTGVDYVSRGADILAGETKSEYLVEYHGLLPMHQEQFERKDIAEPFDYYNKPLKGMVTQDGSYIYQTHEDGVRVHDGRIDDPQDRLQRLTAQIPVRDVKEENPDVSEDVRSRLRELGYA